MGGRPAVIWELRKEPNELVAAFIEAMDEDRAQVTVRGTTQDIVYQDFDTAAEAIRWAFEVQTAFIEEGWRPAA